MEKKNKCTGNKPKMGVVSENGISAPMGLHQKKEVSISVFEMPSKRAERKTHYVKCPINYNVKQVWEQVFSLYIRVWRD